MKKLVGFMTLGLLLLAGISPGHATPYYFGATLDGASENPLVATAGTGSAQIILDDTAHTLTINVMFGGLTGLTTAAHIHCCVAWPGNVGVATMTPSFTGFPLFVTGGIYSHVFDTTLASTFNAPFITLNGGTVAGAEAALRAGLWAGQAYINIHTTFRPGGEIRGFFSHGDPQPVPEPGTFGLLLLGLGALAVRGARRSL